MKKPRAKQARGFSKPFQSRLAVFYVEQVALNRHVQVKRAKSIKRSQKVSRHRAGVKGKWGRSPISPFFEQQKKWRNRATTPFSNCRAGASRVSRMRAPRCSTNRG